MDVVHVTCDGFPTLVAPQLPQLNKLVLHGAEAPALSSTYCGRALASRLAAPPALEELALHKIAWLKNENLNLFTELPVLRRLGMALSDLGCITPAGARAAQTRYALRGVRVTFLKPMF